MVVFLGCGGLLKGDKGTFTSPNFPVVSKDEIECEWIIETAPGTVVSLFVDVLDIQEVERWMYLSFVTFCVAMETLTMEKNVLFL